MGSCPPFFVLVSVALKLWRNLDHPAPTLILQVEGRAAGISEMSTHKLINLEQLFSPTKIGNSPII